MLGNVIGFGENDAKGGKHRTEVTEATEGELGLGAKRTVKIRFGSPESPLCGLWAMISSFRVVLAWKPPRSPKKLSGPSQFPPL